MNNQKKSLLAQFWEDFWSEADNPFFTFLLRAGLFYWIIVVFMSVKDGFSFPFVTFLISSNPSVWLLLQNRNKVLL